MKPILIIILILLTWKVYSQNIPQPNISAPKGLAVNSYTGNLFYQRNEASLRGTGYRIYESFYYNAAVDTLDYGYGHGWSFYYNSFYRQNGDTLIIQLSDAKKDTFYLKNGVYLSPVGVHDTLIKSGTTFILKSKDGKQQFFENSTHKKITRMQDANGNSVVIEYTDTVPVKVRNSTGHCLILTWQNSHLASCQDSANPSKKFSYSYDTNNDMFLVTNPLNGTIRFEYINHTLARLADENSNPVLITYGSGGKVKAINSCNTEQQFTFIDSLKRTFVTQKAQAGTILNGYYFDTSKRLNALSDADGRKVVFTYDNSNNLTSWQDFKGSVTTFQYDSRGNLLQKTDPAGNSTFYTYETTYNNLTSRKDKNGNITTFAYDGKGNLITITQPGNITQSFTYDSQGNRLTSKDANGNTTTYQYNSDGDLTAILYPIGRVQYEYNGSCCGVSKITDANGNMQSMTYDLLGRVTSVTDKLGNTIFYEYDAAGNVIKKTDPNGVPKLYTYDALNRLISVTIKTGTWTYDYDGQGKLIKITDANGHATDYTYNNKGQLVTETDAIGNSTSYSYDLDGNLVLRTEPNGNSITYQYDALNRLTEKTYPGNDDKFNYDAVGNMTAAYNNNIAYSFEYDALNRMLKKNILTWGKTLSYTYDAIGNRKTMTDQDGGIFTYNFDANNRLSNLTNPSNFTTGFTYDGGGRVIRQNNGNGTYTTYHYDDGGRLDSLINWKSSSNKISFFYYTFDRFGNRTSMIDKYGVNIYSYDSSYQLNKVVYADGTTEAFVYDQTGNRVQRTLNSVITPYSYNIANQIQTDGVSKYVFDASGNTTQQDDSLRKTFAYDGMNQLIKVELNQQKNIQFFYDPFGNKIMKQDTLLNNVKMIYDGDNLLSELNNNGFLINEYTAALNIDSWLGKKSGSTDYFYQKDGLNSTSELTSSNGTIINEYGYDVFGNIKSQQANIPNAILYAGHSFENSVNLYDNRARFYNPIIGRFLTKDVTKGIKKSPLSFNKFIYVTNNPTNFIDIYGFEKDEPSVNANNNGMGLKPGYVVTGLKLGGAEELDETLGQAIDTYEQLDKFQNAMETGKEVGEAERERDECLKKKYPDLENMSEADMEQMYGFKQNVAHTIGTTIPSLVEEYIDKAFLFDLFHDPSKVVPDDCNPPQKPGVNPPPTGTKNPPKPIGPVIPRLPGDPNEIIGNSGYDTTRRWVSIKDNLSYKVLFENSPEIATAPAQVVTIYAPIPEKLNPNSLRITDFGFGSFNFTVPANTANYTTRLDVRDSLGVYVDVTAGLDVNNRRAFWTFQSIDPATGLTSSLPVDGGFLPVNDSTKGNGEGYVTFTLQPVDNAQTRDTTLANATIYFDSNEPVPTNVWLNTIDAVAPTSSVTGLSNLVDSVFAVSWNGKDDSLGSGVKSYGLYYSKNGGNFVLYRDNITDTTVCFTGDAGATYGFYTLATDNTGNKEAAKTKADLTTTVKGNGVQLTAKVFLQGPYVAAEGMMTDSLRTKGLLPLSEPYTALGFTTVNNSTGKATQQAVFDSTGTKAVTDWIWIELRSSANSKIVVASRPALLTRGGNIVDIDGYSPVYFNNVLEGSYYVTVRHRNHLGVMSSSTIVFSKTTTATVDFTQPGFVTYGTNAQQNINGVMAMWAGDANGNGSITYNGAGNDKNAILSLVGLSTSNNIITAYLRADCNLDGKISYNGASNDKNKILGSVGLLTPNNIIIEQLPK